MGSAYCTFFRFVKFMVIILIANFILIGITFTILNSSAVICLFKKCSKNQFEDQFIETSSLHHFLSLIFLFLVLIAK
jgi:hypothetical protein